MIYVNQKQLEQVEYLIEQSAKGFHILFDIDIIRKAFKKKGGLEKGLALEKLDPLDKEAEKKFEKTVEKHIENLILQPSLVAKRNYLEKLEPDMFRRVVRTYFSIVENNIFETSKYNQ